MPSPFNICDSLALEKSMVHIEFQNGSRLHHKVARLRIQEKHERMHQEQLHVTSVTRAHDTIILTDTKCNRSRFASLRFLFVLFLDGTIVIL